MNEWLIREVSSYREGSDLTLGKGNLASFNTELFSGPWTKQALFGLRDFEPAPVSFRTLVWLAPPLSSRPSLKIISKKFSLVTLSKLSPTLCP